MAACFAVAHIIVQGRIILVLTFLPGLVPGWLFIRTKLPLAPILFHSMGQTGGWALAYAVLFFVKVHFKSIVDVAIPTCKLSDSL